MDLHATHQMMKRSTNTRVLPMLSLCLFVKLLGIPECAANDEQSSPFSDVQNLMIVVDASHSMSEKLGDPDLIEIFELLDDKPRKREPRRPSISKMELQKALLKHLVSFVPSSSYLGLRVFGDKYRNDGNDCMDTTLLLPLAVHRTSEVLEQLKLLEPCGESPLTLTLYRIFRSDLRDAQPGNITLTVLADGEGCGQDAADLIRKLRTKTGNVPIAVVCLESQISTQKRLRAVAEESHGRFYSIDELDLFLKDAKSLSSIPQSKSRSQSSLEKSLEAMAKARIENRAALEILWEANYANSPSLQAELRPFQTVAELEHTLAAPSSQLGLSAVQAQVAEAHKLMDTWKRYRRQKSYIAGQHYRSVLVKACGKDAVHRAEALIGSTTAP